MNKLIVGFEKFAGKTSAYAGRPIVFVSAVTLVIIWALTGPIFNFSDTWQLVINTSTTIITFLMVFLVQSSQNRDSKALQLKLDELIFKMQKADNVMIDIENLSERQLNEIAERYKQLRIDLEAAPNAKAKNKTLQDAFAKNGMASQKTKTGKKKAPDSNKKPKKT